MNLKFDTDLSRTLNLNLNTLRYVDCAITISLRIHVALTLCDMISSLRLWGFVWTLSDGDMIRAESKSSDEHRKRFEDEDVLCSASFPADLQLWRRSSS